MNIYPSLFSKRLFLTLALLVGTGFFPLWLLVVFLFVAICSLDWYFEGILVFALFLASFNAVQHFYLYIIIAVLLLVVVNQVRTSVFKS
jgi:hypothetical protein